MDENVNPTEEEIEKIIEGAIKDMENYYTCTHCGRTVESSSTSKRWICPMCCNFNSETSVEGI